MKKKNKILPLTQSNRKFFQIFYESYINFLIYIADKYAETPEDRQDLVQESWARLLKNVSVLRKLDRGRTAKYIELTVKTAYLDQEQQRCREKMLLLDPQTLETLLDLKSYGQEESAAVGEAVATLKKRLTRRQWLLLEGKYILGYSHRELSRAFGVDENSIRSMVFRAKKEAMDILRETAEEEDERYG